MQKVTLCLHYSSLGTGSQKTHSKTLCNKWLVLGSRDHIVSVRSEEAYRVEEEPTSFILKNPVGLFLLHKKKKIMLMTQICTVTLSWSEAPRYHLFLTHDL